MSVCFFLLPLVSTFTHFTVLAALLGFMAGPLVTLTTEILCNTFGLDKLTSTYGICCLFRGLGGLLGPPFIGHICHLNKDHFELGFYAAGGIMSITFVLNVMTQISLNLRNTK